MTVQTLEKDLEIEHQEVEKLRKININKLEYEKYQNNEIEKLKDEILHLKQVHETEINNQINSHYSYVDKVTLEINNMMKEGSEQKRHLEESHERIRLLEEDN